MIAVPINERLLIMHCANIFFVSLALVCRVQINVLGRPTTEMSEDREMKRVFLRSLQHIMSDQGMEQIVEITRTKSQIV